MQQRERDAALERVLRRTWRADETSSAGVCLDAGALAAWAEGSLSARERAAAEAHTAGCARCQALLTVMARTESADPAASSADASARSAIPAFFRWLVPLTACGLAVALWVGVNPGAPPPASPDTASFAEPSTPVETPAQPATADSVAGAERDLRAKQEDLRKVPPPAESRARVESPAAPRTDAPAATPGKTREEATIAGAPVAEPPPAVSGVGGGRILSTDASRQAPRAAAPMRRAAEELLVTGAAQEATAVDILSADPGSRWRIAGGRVVQHSTDAGVTWTTKPTGATERLTSGMCPSATVCWLIGPGGTVLLTTDGTTWDRLAFPEKVDLVRVTATDARTATVSTVDGRAFVTADGGVSWVAREQEQ